VISIVFPKVRLARPKQLYFGRIRQSASSIALKATFRSYSPKCIWQDPKSEISIAFHKLLLARPKKRDFGRIPRSASGEAQKA